MHAPSPFDPSPEHRHLREVVRDFAEAEVDPQAQEFNKEEKFNRKLFNRLGELGLLGVTVPEEYHGSGMDATAACIIHEELAAADPAFTLSYLAHSILFANNLARNGSEELKHTYLPKACSGELVGGMCMSEAEAGTDVLGMRTRVEQTGPEEFSISGHKMWITNGTLDGSTTGDVFLVYASSKSPEASSSSSSSKSFSLFLVEKGTRGFTLGQQIKNK